MQNLTFEQQKFFVIVLIVLVLWSIPWHALALWKSARRGQVGWFMFFILINTAGIVEIIYLKYLSKVKAKNLDVSNAHHQNHNSTRNIEKRRIV